MTARLALVSLVTFATLAACWFVGRALGIAFGETVAVVALYFAIGNMAENT